MKTCAWCGVRFSGRRWNARYCSDRCREARSGRMGAPPVGARCAYCELDATEYDNAVPTSRGGAHHPTNLVPACKGCNAQKGGRTPEEFAAWRADRRLRVAAAWAAWGQPPELLDAYLRGEYRVHTPNAGGPGLRAHRETSLLSGRAP